MNKIKGNEIINMQTAKCKGISQHLLSGNMYLDKIKGRLSASAPKAHHLKNWGL